MQLTNKIILQAKPTVWIPHVPKIAGKSRHRMLVNVNEYTRWDHDRNIGIPLKNNIVAGHSAVLENPDWIKILFVRDPVERFWSSYYYTRRYHPNIDLSDYLKGITAPIRSWIQFTSTIDWLTWQQKSANCNWQLDLYKWDYIFTINELDKFREVMQGLGYDLDPATHVNCNPDGDIDYSKLDTPELEVINTEYKYYTDLGIKL